MTLQEKIVEIALSQVGVKEEGGNNQGPEIVKYQLATWLAPGPWPWCAAFTCWVLDQAKIATGVNITRCFDASAYGWEKWARKYEFEVLPETKLAKAGDFVTFDFSHIGVVVKNEYPEDGVIYTVEGNTNHKGERDSESGDGVWKKTRPKHLVKSLIRLPDK